MKKIVITAAVALFSLTTISACANNNGTANNAAHHNNMQQHHSQYADSAHMGMGSGMNNMMAQLNLTAEQKAQLQSLRQNNRSHRMQNHQATLEILTPEQRQKLTQMQSQHMNNGGHMMNKGHTMNKGQHMNQ